MCSLQNANKLTVTDMAGVSAHSSIVARAETDRQRDGWVEGWIKEGLWIPRWIAL